MYRGGRLSICTVCEVERGPRSACTASRYSLPTRDPVPEGCADGSHFVAWKRRPPIDSVASLLEHRSGTRLSLVFRMWSSLCTPVDGVADMARVAIQLGAVGPGNDYSDPHALAPALQNRTRIALGKSTHGVRIVLQVTHRLIQKLIAYLGITPISLDMGRATDADRIRCSLTRCGPSGMSVG